MFASNTAGSFGGQNNQNQGLFGGSNNQSAGMFNNNKPNNGAGLFGSIAQSNNSAFSGAQNNSNAFVAAQNSQGNGLFGGNNNSNQGTGSFFNSQQPTNNAQNNIFGAPPAQQPSNGIFGAPNNIQNNGGIFGAAQQNNGNGSGSGGIFGAPQNSVQNNGGGIFGNSTQPTGMLNQNQNQGIGMFTTNQTNPSPFGVTSSTTGFLQNNNQQPNKNNTGSLFGNMSTNANNAFLGAQSNTNPLGSNTATNLFGANQANQTQASPFMNNTQQNTPNNNGTGLFNTFSNSNSSPLSSFGQPATNNFGQQNNNSNFGQSTNATSNLFGANNNNNKLGGTAWGIPTNLTTNSSTNANQQIVASVQPVRSKNSKLLDQKHLIKSIAALDQFYGLSKEEIRISYIQSGGQQIIQQNNGSPATNNMNSAFKTGSSNNGPGQVSLPAFGTSSNLFGATTNNLGANNQNNMAKPSLFASQAPQTNTFGQVGSLFAGQGNATGQLNNTTLLGQPVTNSLFDQNNQQQQPLTTSLFGQTNTPSLNPTSSFGGLQTQAQGSLFGQNPQQTNSLFGNTSNQNSLLGTVNSQQQQSSLFGNTSNALVGGLLGQNNSIWNNTQGQIGATQQQGSLFSQPATQGSLFGQSQGPSTFGQTSVLNQNPLSTQQPGSLFNPQPNLANPATNSFLNPNPLGMTQTGSLGVQPTQAISNVFSQLASPLVPMAPMDQNLQLLLPQMLLALALGNNQNNPSNQNITLDLVSKLTNMIANNNNNDKNLNNSSNNNNYKTNADNSYGSYGLTPFDMLMK